VALVELGALAALIPGFARVRIGECSHIEKGRLAMADFRSNCRAICAGIGAIVGLAIGAVVTKSPEGAAAGAVVGGVLGYAYGAWKCPAT